MTRYEKHPVHVEEDDYNANLYSAGLGETTEKVLCDHCNKYHDQKHSYIWLGFMLKTNPVQYVKGRFYFVFDQKEMSDFFSQLPFGTDKPVYRILEEINQSGCNLSVRVTESSITLNNPSS